MGSNDSHPRVGDLVTLATLPPWVERLPEESRRVFRFCVGKTFRVDDIESGQLVLDVSEEVDPVFGGYKNDIRVEPELVVLVEKGAAVREKP